MKEIKALKNGIINIILYFGGGKIMKERQIISFRDSVPDIAPNVYVSEGVRIVGNVEIQKDCGIWFNTVIRGDVAKVVVKKGSNIQDNSTLHVGHGYPCIVGENVTVGHNVLLHGSVVGDHCLIGMGSILLNGSEIGEYSVVAAGSLVTQKSKFPPRSLIMGSPAKVVRELSNEEIKQRIFSPGEGYLKRSKEYIEEQSMHKKE